MDADRPGQHLAVSGWNAGTFDSIGVAVMPTDGGAPVMWATGAAEQGGAHFLDDGSILFAPWDTPESIQLYRLRTPGSLERFGAAPRPVAGVSVSDDLKRAAVLEVSYHGDAYMSRIVRP